MMDVAKRAGVSVTTVSHVLNKTRKVSPDTVRAVEEAIAALGFAPNTLARAKPHEGRLGERESNGLSGRRQDDLLLLSRKRRDGLERPGREIDLSATYTDLRQGLHCSPSTADPIRVCSKECPARPPNRQPRRHYPPRLAAVAWARSQNLNSSTFFGVTICAGPSTTSPLPPTL